MMTLIRFAIVLGLASTAFPQTGNVLRNGGFEVEPVLDGDLFIRFSVVDGWASESRLEFYDFDLAVGEAFEGTQALEVDEFDLARQVARVVAGQTYTLSFATALRPNASEDRTLAIRFDGQPVDTITKQLSAGGDWTTHVYEVQATSGRGVLEFEDLTGGPRGLRIDGCALVGPVPAPERRGEVLYFTGFDGRGPESEVLTIAGGDMFARSIANLGDFDGDGIVDLAIGSIGIDGPHFNQGGLWLVFPNADGGVKQARKITQGVGGFTGVLSDEDGFGRALTRLPDLDGNGVDDLAVGANYDDDAGEDAGAVWILFMNADGTVGAHHKITAVSGVDAFSVPPLAGHELGSSVAALDDLDGDGLCELAVGRRGNDSVSICFLNSDGTVRASHYVRAGLGKFDESLALGSFFGMSCAALGDVNGDGVGELAVGAYGRKVWDEPFVGAVYVLSLAADGSVATWSRIGPEELNPLGFYLGAWDEFAVSCAGPGDVDGDGIPDLAVGAHREGPRFGRNLNEGKERGGLYIVFLNADGSPKDARKIGDTDGELDVALADHDRLGEGLAPLGDFDGDGQVDLAVGSRFMGTGGGAFFLYLNDGTREPARAAFSAAPTRGIGPLNVVFQDLSSGDYDQLDWDLGDGTQLVGAGPHSHSYTSPGSYTVRLTVRGSGGIDLVERRNVIQVVTDAHVERYGCGENPAGSLTILNGTPRLGSLLRFGLDNPLGTMGPMSATRIFVSLLPDAAFPCGSAAMGLGLDGGDGAYLIKLGGANPILERSGTFWNGPGQLGAVIVGIPNVAFLSGRELYVQGLLVNGSNTGPALGVTDALKLTLYE